MNKRLFQEWETCTSNPELLDEYKKIYYQNNYWAQYQYGLKDEKAKVCLDQISPIRFNTRVIYNTVEKLSQPLTYSGAIRLVFSPITLLLIYV